MDFIEKILFANNAKQWIAQFFKQEVVKYLPEI